MVIEDGRVERVELPEPMRGGYAFGLSATDDGFLGWRGDEGSLQMLTSSDGRDWALEESLADDVEGPVGGWHTGPDGLEVWGYDEASERNLYWVSPDGIEWQLRQPPQGDFKARMGSGWVALVAGGLAYYPDGSEEMLRIDATPRLKADSWGAGGAGMARISENTIRHSVFEDGPGGPRDHWIVTFEDLPVDDE